MVRRKILCAILMVLLAGFFDAVWAKARVEVNIEGVDGELKKNVLSFLSLERQKNAPELDEPTIKDLFRRAPDEIRAALQPFGFYDPRISSELANKDETWHAHFLISPGEPVRITKLHMEITGEGAEEAYFESFRQNFPLKKGDVLDQQVYEKTKRDLQEIAANYGFLNATLLRHRIQVYPERHAAEILLVLDTGPQFHFGDVSFIQNTLSSRFLERYITFKKGDTYNASLLLDLQSSLNASGYFKEVLVTPVRKEGLEVPIEIKLTPAKRYQVSLGAGYGTDTGLRGRLEWTDRWVNRRGHLMDIDLRLAQIEQNAVWKYTVPLKHPGTEHLDYILGYVAESTNIETSETYKAGASYTRPLSSHWIQTLYFNVEREHFSVAEDTATSRLILPGGTWIYKKALERVYVNEGFRLIADLTGTSKAMLSSITFIQGRLQPKYVRGIGGFGSIILRGDFGATEVDNFHRLPASLRFFAGGDNSIRGYSYKSLGPVNAAGQVEGGKFLMVASIEYDQKIYKKWGAAVFYDGGNAFSSFPPDWKSGGGVGIRWLSPVGPVRVDFAWALSEPSHTFHIHVNIGPEI
jgi:translocation and assembly module TamA